MTTTYEPPVPIADTEAAGARWSEGVEECWPGALVIWANGYYDYQGDAEVLAVLPDGRYLVCEWTYGSCSGCDGYEGLGESEFVEQFRANGDIFTSEGLAAYGANLPDGAMKAAIEALRAEPLPSKEPEK